MEKKSPMPLPADAELIRRDPEIPGLALLLDEEKLTQRLVHLVPRLRGHRLKCSYLRYKPGTNCIAAYRVEPNAGGATADDLIHFYAKAFRSHANPKLWKGGGAARRGPDASESPLVLTDAAISLHVFPNDRRLPALKSVASSERRRLLRKLVPDQPELWDASVTLLRYKPERRCVLRLDSPNGAQATMRCYAPAEFAASDSHGFQSRAGLRIPSRLGRSRRHKLIMNEWAIGQPFADAIGRSSADTCHRVGAALANIHLQDVHGLKLKTRRAEIRELRSVTSAVGFLCPHLAHRCERVLQTLTKRLLTSPVMVYPLHGDFYADQVLVTDEHVCILDLDEALLGDPAADVGSFTCHLDHAVDSGRLNVDDAESLTESFLDGYRQIMHVPRDRVSVYHAAALLRLATQPFRTRQANWPVQIEWFVAQAERVLGSLPSADDARLRPVMRRKSDAEHPHVADPQFEGWSPDVKPLSRANARQLECHVDVPDGVLQDPKLSTLVAPALEPTRVVDQFQRFLPGFPVFAADVQLRAICVVRHKPGRRCLIAYEFARTGQTQAEPEWTLLGKVHAKRPDLVSYRTQQALFSRSFGLDADDGVVVPEPLGVIPEWNMWVQRRVGGEPATGLLESAAAAQLAGRIAEAIHKVHLSHGPLHRRHTPRDEVRILRERLPKVSRSRTEWREPIERILDACDGLASRLPGEISRPIHRDFYPEQVLVDGERITLLDFDLCCEGDPALDVGNFHAHLTEQALRHFGRADALARVQFAFAERYSELAGADVRGRIDDYATLSLVRHIYISTLIPDRRHLTEALIDLAASQLNVRLNTAHVTSISDLDTPAHQPREMERK